MSYRFRFACVIGLGCVFAVLGGGGQASALTTSTFPLYNDPFSTPFPAGSAVIGGLNNNDLIQTINVQNSGPAHDILLAVLAFQDGNVTGDLSWDQSKNGWYGNVGGTTLLVTASLPGSLPWSEVADSTGLVQETFTVFGQTVGPPNAYPFIDLGTIPGGGTDVFVATLHFAWGDGRSGVTPLHGGWVETLAPNPNFVPEPSTLILLGSGAFGLLGMIRRKLRA
jgi:hypothetical protein